MKPEKSVFSYQDFVVCSLRVVSFHLEILLGCFSCLSRPFPRKPCTWPSSPVTQLSLVTPSSLILVKYKPQYDKRQLTSFRNGLSPDFHQIHKVSYGCFQHQACAYKIQHSIWIISMTSYLPDRVGISSIRTYMDLLRAFVSHFHHAFTRFTGLSSLPGIVL